MALTLDPEIAKALQQLMGDAAPSTPPAVGDVKSRRVNVEAFMSALNGLLEPANDVDKKSFTTKSFDGASIELTWYEKRGAPKGSAALYIHGGGMILGSVAGYDGVIADYVTRSGVPMLAVEYRLAPEAPHPAPVEDCYAALVWLSEHVGELGVDPKRIAVMGDSAGGGLSAGVALLARGRKGPTLAKQILIYPMIDDTTTTLDAAIAPFASWSYDDNITGWRALLGDKAGTADVHHAAAPIRATDVNGLPSTYIEVGQLDIFCREDIAYAAKLAAANIELELHVHPGAQHGFERMAASSAVGLRSRADRLRVLRSF